MLYIVYIKIAEYVFILLFPCITDYSDLPTEFFFIIHNIHLVILYKIRSRFCAECYF